MVGTVRADRIGGRIARLRRARGLSQSALGKALSESRKQSWVSGVEAGKWRPSFEEAHELAEYFDVPLMWLVYGAREAAESDEAAEVSGYMRALDRRGRRELVRVGRVLLDELREEQRTSDHEAAIQRVLDDPVASARLEELLAARIASHQAETAQADQQATARPPRAAGRARQSR